MTDSWYKQKQFMSNGMEIEGRRSQQVFSFNPMVRESVAQRNTIQSRSDIDNIMKRYLVPVGQQQSYQLQQQQQEQQHQESTRDVIRFVDSRPLDSRNYGEVASSQKYQVNYPNLLDDDTSLMTSVNASKNPGEQQIGMVNPFMKNFEMSLQAEQPETGEEQNHQNYDRFYQFEHLDMNNIESAAKTNQHADRVTFGAGNSIRTTQTRSSQQVINSPNGSQQFSSPQQPVANPALKIFSNNSQRNSLTANSPFNFSNSHNQNANSHSQEQQQFSGQFGKQENRISSKQNDNMILKDIFNDEGADNDNIFGSDEDLTKQEEQEQRVNQMHAEISVLNNQVHKMLSTYKNQLEKQSDRRQVKQNVKQDASILSKNYRDIINKFEDLSQNDISMISMNSQSRNNPNNIGNNTFLKGTCKKEKEINVMMNLVEQFLYKFDEDFQAQSVIQANKQQAQQESPQTNQLSDQQRFPLPTTTKQLQKPNLVPEQKQQYDDQKRTNQAQGLQMDEFPGFSTIKRDFENLSQQSNSANTFYGPKSQSKDPQLQLKDFISQQNSNQNTSNNKSNNMNIQQNFSNDYPLDINRDTFPQNISPMQNSLSPNKDIYQQNSQQKNTPLPNMMAFNILGSDQKQLNTNLLQNQVLNQQQNVPITQMIGQQQNNQYLYGNNFVEDHNPYLKNQVQNTSQQVNLEFMKVKNFSLEPMTNYSIPNHTTNSNQTQTNPQYSQDNNCQFIMQNIIPQQIQIKDATTQAQTTLSLPRNSVQQQQQQYQAQQQQQLQQPQQLQHQQLTQYQTQFKSSLPEYNSVQQLQQMKYSDNQNYWPSNPQTNIQEEATNLNGKIKQSLDIDNLILMHPKEHADNPFMTQISPQAYISSQSHGQQVLFGDSFTPLANPQLDQFEKVKRAQMSIPHREENICIPNTLMAGVQRNNSNPEVFEASEKLDLYCTNCDGYFKQDGYFDHVKNCDKAHALKLNALLDDTFYNLEQSTQIMNNLDQKIDKISRNFQNALQLQKIPQTRNILAETIKDLAEILKSENSSTVKKILKKLDQSSRELIPNGHSSSNSSPSYRLYLYLKRVTNILREKETALEQSAMLKEISLVYPPQQQKSSSIQANKQSEQMKMEPTNNFYPPRFSVQPTVNPIILNTNYTNFQRNTVSNNQDLEKKSKFYDLAGEIKNKLPPNHKGGQLLISELYQEAKSLQESQWKTFLQAKFNLNN